MPEADSHNAASQANTPINSAFETVAVEHTLEVVDRRSMTFRSEHKFSLLTQIPSRFFVREYFWTGSGAENEPIPELVTDIDKWGFPHQRIHGPLLVERNARTLVVDLGRTFRVGEAVDIHFRHRMRDLMGTFQPHFMIRPSHKIRNRIALRLVLPTWSGLRVTYRQLAPDTEEVITSACLSPVSERDCKLTFEKEIVNPNVQNMGHILEWDHSYG